MDPVLKILYIERDTHDRNGQSFKVLFSLEKILWCLYGLNPGCFGFHRDLTTNTHHCQLVHTFISNPQNSQSACLIIQTWGGGGGGGVDLNIYISYKYRMCLSSVNKMPFQKKKLMFVKFVYRVTIKIIGSATELASLARA